MTQQKTTLISGQNSLRGYSEDGVFTPASGLEEYIYYKFIEHPDDGNDLAYQIRNNVPLIIVNFHSNFTNQSTGAESITLSVEGEDLIYTMKPDSGDSFINTGIPFVLPENTTIKITNGGFGIASLYLLCKRVALNSIEVVAGNSGFSSDITFQL